MSDVNTFTCHTCGWQWERGQSGNHDCATRLCATITSQRREIERLEEELNWQNNRNSGHPTKGGFEFYINEEWTGIASAAIDADYGWHAALRKKRIDPDDERVRIRRVAEDDTILKQLADSEAAVAEAREKRDWWQRQAEAFKKEADDAHQLFQSEIKRNASLATELTATQAKLADAVRDTERLDWLNRYVLELHLTLGRVLEVNYGRDVRLVIDAARATSPAT